MKYPGVQKIIDILKNIDNGPRSKLGFDMNYEAINSNYSKHPCGRACCIGGHAAIALNDPNLEVANALELLCDISSNDARDICWPQDKDYDSITLEQAISMLEYYRDTGEIDWSLE